MDLKNLKAKDIMVRDVVTAKPTDKIGATDLMMIRASIGGVPVVNGNNRLLGIITQRDIMLSRFTVQISSSKVEDLMTRDVISCDEDSELKDILDMMINHNIERLPVVNHDNRLMGLIVHANIMEKLFQYLKNNGD